MKVLSDCRVLLVDDAKANLDILVEGLKSEHKLSLAMNGEMALRLARARHPISCCSTSSCPAWMATKCAGACVRWPETAEVPIMFLSSLEEVHDKTRGFEAGANDYVTKPFDMLEVRGARAVAAQGQGLQRRGERADRQRIAHRP